MPSSSEFSKYLYAWTEIVMRRTMHEFLRFTHSQGLKMTQISLLMRLHHQGRCNISEIGEHLDMTKAAASQLVERLVQNGLIERWEDTQDRRVKQVALTEKGRALIAAAAQARLTWLEDLDASLPEADQPAAAAALARLIQAAKETA